VSKPELDPADAQVMVNIVDDMVLRGVAAAERGDYDVAAYLDTMVAYLALCALQKGVCRTVMLNRLEQALAGRCPCELETKGSA
jgi:hypothetical protein